MKKITEKSKSNEKKQSITAIFVKSSSNVSQCPEEQLPEFAFIGRSNVGKSSLINCLTNHKNLAKTSSTPGKTLLINHFKIDEKWFLVDLPGYGYARVGKKKLEELDRMITGYVTQREQLLATFVLIDSRLPPQKVDIDFMNSLIINQVPFAIIFTKADKNPVTKLQSMIAAYIRELKKIWEEIPPYFVTSAETGAGKEQLLQYIQMLIIDFNS
jgi:GTP-binding protein